MIKIYENRNQMLLDLPKNLIVAELGVFNGTFSESILKICEPSQLILIDLWENTNIMSGDVDGNNVVKINGEDLYNQVNTKFQNVENIVIHRDYTTSAMSKYPDDYFDVVYIDADHSYSGCMADLEISFKKVKSGGYIMGHDYEQNFEKTKNVYNFGVNRAVNEFCQKYSQTMSIKANDGCVSYGIKIKKII
jgi:hypothetical protein